MGEGSVRSSTIAAGLLLAGCTQTSRVDDNLSTASLSQSKKAVAVMRVGAASPSCINVAVLLGVREGDGYRRHQGITVMNVRSLTEPAVAEVELDPGEYHVVAYRCQSKQGIKTVADGAGAAALPHQLRELHAAAGRGRQRRLPACRAPGGIGHNAFGRPVEMDIEVTDWPLAELDRFKAKRPHIFTQMTTRLMTVTDREPGEPGPQECARLKALQAEGKVQQLPPACSPPATAARKGGAVAKSGGSL